MPEASTLLIEIPEQNHEMPVGDPGHGPKRKRNDADLEEERKGKIQERTAEQKTARNERTKARRQQRAAAQKETDAEKQKARRDNPIYRAKNAQEQKKSSANMSEEKKAKRKAQQLELASTPAAKAANALSAKKHQDNMPEERREEIHANRTQRNKQSVENNMLTFDTLLADYPTYPEAPVIGEVNENPSSAVLKYYLMNGCMDFHKANMLPELAENKEDKEKYDSTVNDLVEELKGQLPSHEKLEQMRKDYIHDTGIANMDADDLVSYTNMFCCGCCGVKELDVNDEFKKVKLSDLDLLLVPNDCPYRSILKDPMLNVPADNKGTMKQLDLREAMNWYKDASSDRLYWLHPEFVDTGENTTHSANEPGSYGVCGPGDNGVVDDVAEGVAEGVAEDVTDGEMTDKTICVGSTWLCKSCFQSLRGPGTPSIPAHSLALVNFGSARRLGLPELNPLTRMVISKIRNHRIVLKLLANNLDRTDATGSTLRGHYIMFNHDAPNVLAKQFLKLKSFEDIFTVHMICADGKKDWMLQRAWQTEAINIQSHVAYQYLAVLKKLHKEYSDLKLPSFEAFKETIASLKANLRENTMLDENTEMALLEDNIGADVGNVRSEKRQGPVVDKDAVQEEVDRDEVVVEDSQDANEVVVEVDAGEDTNLTGNPNPEPALGSYYVHNPPGSRCSQRGSRKDVSLELLVGIGKNLNLKMSACSEPEPHTDPQGVTNEMDCIPATVDTGGAPVGSVGNPTNQSHLGAATDSGE